MSASAALYSNLAEAEENLRNFHQEMALFLAKYVLGWNVKNTPKGMVFQKPFGKVIVLDWDPLTKAKDYEEVLQGFIRNPIWHADYIDNYGPTEIETNRIHCMERMVEIVEEARRAMERLKAI